MGWRRSAYRCWRTGRSYGTSGEAVNLEGLWDLNHDPLGQAHARETLPERIRVLCREGALNVLLSHRPGLLEEYGAGGADVVFCGHAHGGQVRLPLVGPVFAPDEGLFPKHTAGVYRTGRPGWWSAGGLGNGTPLSPAVERAGAGGRDHAAYRDMRDDPCLISLRL